MRNDLRQATKACVLEVSSRIISAGDEPPDRFVHEYGGTVRLLDETYTPGEAIGEFELTVLDIVSAVNERQSIFDVFDWSADTIDYFEDLYESDGSFKARVERLHPGSFAGMWEPNILLLQRLKIRPEHRGLGYGLQALQAMVEEFRLGVGIIAMKPFPLQFEGGARPRLLELDDEDREFGFDRFTTNFRTSRAKLRRYYARLGFQLVPKTDVMVMSAARTARFPAPWRGDLE